jgi:hypothetical protein
VSTFEDISGGVAQYATRTEVSLEGFVKKGRREGKKHNILMVRNMQDQKTWRNGDAESRFGGPESRDELTAMSILRFETGD